MYFSKYPVGPPEVRIRFSEEEKETLPFLGLIKCRIQPPTGLALPLLPYRLDSRLTFPLCGKCAKINDERAECAHTDEERTLVSRAREPEKWHEKYDSSDWNVDGCGIEEGHFTRLQGGSAR